MVDGHSTKPWSYYYDSFAVDGPAQLFLRRGNGDVFSDTSLPTSLSLSSFDDAKFYYFYYSPTDFAWVAFTAQITTLNRLATAVPEPTSYAMFGLGLCLLGLVLRRKSGGDRVLAA
nr:PEP-CTERM sorting domain-containing protein [Duganella sp. 1224]